MTKQEFLDHLVRLGACDDARDYVRAYELDDARTIWETCERLDWLLWLGWEVGLRADAIALACDYAERALPIWEAWARDRAPEHLDAPRAAVDAARSGARRFGDDAANAARAAASAADAAADERAWQLAHTRSILTWDRIEQAMVTL